MTEASAFDTKGSSFDAGELEASTGPLDPMGGVKWELWTTEMKEIHMKETKCVVVYRQRQQ